MSKQNHSNFRVYSYTPSALAKCLYFYPLHVGSYFVQEFKTGFLLIYVRKGSFEGFIDKKKFLLKEKQVLFVDSSLLEVLKSSMETQLLWLHFDGPMARRFYHTITEENGNIILPNSSFHCEKLLQEIFDTFDFGYSINEPVISKYITDTLNELLKPQPVKSDRSQKIQESIRYMNDHLELSLSVDDLAERVFLSPYHFIRLFKKFTGKTPHEYLIDLRIDQAKYYLKSTEKSVKEIAFLCGFSSESNFCNSFRKRIGSSPLQYRK